MSREWDEEEQCGKCAYNTYDKKERCYVCSNKESENYGLMTYYDETCEDFEGEETVMDQEMVTMADNRELRAIIHDITGGIFLTKTEYVQIVMIIQKACDRNIREEVV